MARKQMFQVDENITEGRKNSLKKHEGPLEESSRTREIQKQKVNEIETVRRMIASSQQMFTCINVHLKKNFQINIQQQKCNFMKNNKLAHSAKRIKIISQARTAPRCKDS